MDAHAARFRMTKEHILVETSQMSVSQIATIIPRWLTVLAGLATAARVNWQRRRTVIVTEENARLKLRTPMARRVNHRGSCGRCPIADAAVLQHRFIRFVMNDATIVRRRLTVPAQAREFLAGVIANRIERLSPWPATQVAYGFDTAGRGKCCWHVRRCHIHCVTNTY